MDKDDKVSTLNLDDILDTTGNIVIDLNDTYGTTTTYWAGDSVTDITIGGSNDGTFTVDTIDISTLDNITSDYRWAYENTKLDKLEIEKMCKEYPALEKVWRNFKSVYDMVKQDYEGKKKAGEIADDIPF